jgi:cytochrome c-type biogenesis protein CcmH
VTTFLILCAVMVVAALVLVLVPLLTRVPAAAGREAESPRAVPAAVVLLVALPLAASALYGSLSNFPWDNPDAAAAGGGHAAGAGTMGEATAALQARLEQNPADLEGWRMLGRTYLVTGRVADAVAAYEKASSLTGGRDPAVELDLAEALVLVGDPQAQPRAKGIIDAALAADPDSQKALWYSGLIAMRAGDTETTKTQWKKLLDSNPPPQIRDLLVTQLEGLGESIPPGAGGASTTPAAGGMGSMAGMSAGMGSPGSVAAEPSGRTIRVSVAVDPSLAARMRPGTVVFVSAREAGIPGPPLAAVRLTTDDLPATVTLSDANAMVEGRNLSSVDEVQVVARVAFGGTAVTASGDLVGEARHKKGAPAELNVLIDRMTP